MSAKVDEAKSALWAEMDAGLCDVENGHASYDDASVRVRNALDALIAAVREECADTFDDAALHVVGGTGPDDCWVCAVVARIRARGKGAT